MKQCNYFENLMTFYILTKNCPQKRKGGGGQSVIHSQDSYKYSHYASLSLFNLPCFLPFQPATYYAF